MCDRVEKGLEREVAVKWLIQLVNALHHLHTHRFFHRAITAGNVFITPEDEVRIGNFSSMIEEDQTNKTVILANNAPPELWEFSSWKRKTYDMKVDVWMLGWLLFQIFNKNQAPFPVGDYCDVFTSEFEDKQERFEQWRRELEELQAPEVIPEAKEIYLQMLVFDPQQRPSIQQVKDSPAF